MSKEGVLINKVIDIYIKNNEEEYNVKNIDSKYKDNSFIFKVNNDEYNINLIDKIVFHKKSDESKIDFVFDINKETKGTYYINELEFYMDAKVKTVKLIREDNYIEVEYKLWLQDEEIGNFIFILKVKE